MANANFFGGGYSHGSAAQEENMFRRTNVVLHKEDTRLVKTSLGVALIYKDEMSKLINGLEGHVGLNEGVCFRDIEEHSYAFLPRERIFSFFELRSAAENLMSLRETSAEYFAINFANNQTFIDLLMELNINRDKVLSDNISNISAEYIKTFGDANQETIISVSLFIYNYYDNLRKKIRAQLQTLKDAGIRHVVLSAFGCGAFRNPPHVVAECYRRVIESYKSHFDVIAFAIIGKPKFPEKNFLEFKRILMSKDLPGLSELNKKIEQLSKLDVNEEIPNLSALKQTHPPHDRVYKQSEITWQRINKTSGELTDIGRDTSYLINNLSEKPIMTETSVMIIFNFVEATCIIGGGGLAAGKECKIRTTQNGKEWEYENNGKWVSFESTYSNGINDLINTICQIEYEGTQYRFLSAKLLSVDDFSSNPEVIPLKKKISQLPTPKGPPPGLSPTYNRGASEPESYDKCIGGGYQILSELLADKTITDMIKADIKNDKKQKHWIWWIFPLKDFGLSDPYKITLPKKQIPCLFKDENWNEIISALYEKFKPGKIKWYNYFPEIDRQRISEFITNHAEEFIHKGISIPMDNLVKIIFHP